LKFGEKYTGKVVLQCEECHFIWTLQAKNLILAETMGLKCPKCQKVTGNRVLRVVQESALDQWF